MVVTLTKWDGRPGTFKDVWLGNLKAFANSVNSYMAWMNDDIGLFNGLALNLDLTLPAYFGRERRLKIQAQMKQLRLFLVDVEKMLNESSYQEYDDDGNAIPYQLAIQALTVPLTNDAKNYNALFDELNKSLAVLGEFKNSNESN